MTTIFHAALLIIFLLSGATAKKPLWVYNFPSNEPQAAFNPTIFQDLVLVPTNTTLHAFHSTSGKQLWSFRYPNDDNGGYAAVGNGTVYVGCFRYLYALEILTGSLQWSVAAPPSRPASVLTHLRPSLGKDALYLTTGYTPLMKLNPANGRLVWATTPATGIAQLHATESPNGKHVFVVVQTGSASSAVCFDVESGLQKWNVSGVVTIMVPAEISLLLCQGGNSSASTLSAFDLESGALVYERVFNGMQALDYYTYQNDVYVDVGATPAPFPTQLLKLDGSTGYTKWAVSNVSFLFFIPCSSGVAVFGANSVVGYTKQDGSAVWSYPAVAVNDGATTYDDIVITITSNSVVALSFY